MNFDILWISLCFLVPLLLAVPPLVKIILDEGKLRRELTSKARTKDYGEKTEQYQHEKTKRIAKLFFGARFNKVNKKSESG